MVGVGIIGTGAMGEDHAHAYSRLEGVDVVACFDIDHARAVGFAEKYGVPTVHTSASDLFNHPGLSAVSIVTTDQFHAPLTLQAIDHGLHVLCEKPLATSVEDAQRMAAAANAAGVVHLVNFSYRRSAALSEVRRMIMRGDLGSIRHFEAHYLQSWLISSKWGDWKTDPKWLWRLSTQHGSGGALGDIGVHLLDFVTFAAGDVDWVECNLKTFQKHPTGRIGDYLLDANDAAVITMALKNGAIGTLHTSRWATGHLNSIGFSIHGDKGAVRINLDTSYDRYESCLGADVDDAVWSEHVVESIPSVIERFVTCIQTGERAQPDFSRGAYVQEVLAACFESGKAHRRVAVTTVDQNR